MQQNSLLGYKVMPFKEGITRNELFQKYSTTANDWSAIYIQMNLKHSMTYIYNKYELFEEVCLMKFLFNQTIRFVKLTDSTLVDGKISSQEKANIVRQMLPSKYNIFLNNDIPLMDGLGMLNIGLIMEDSEKQFEYIVPHELMQKSLCYDCYSLIRFVRHKERIFRTIKIVFNNQEHNPEAQYQDRIHEWPIPDETL